MQLGDVISGLNWQDKDFIYYFAAADLQTLMRIQPDLTVLMEKKGATSYEAIINLATFLQRYFTAHAQAVKSSPGLSEAQQ